MVPYSVRRLLLDFPRESQLAVSTGLKQLQLTAIVALLVPPALLAVIWRRPSGRVLAASQPGPGNGASAAGPEQVATPVAQTSPGHSGTAPGGPSCRRARWRLVGAAGVSLLCSLAVASCGSATPGSPRPKSTPAGTASPAATASGVDTRLLVQQGLSIGLASNVVQSQVTVLVDALLGSNSCSALSSGTGSSRVVQRSTAGSVTTADVDVYYDASCSQPYIVAAATLTTSSATQTITIDETATYYGPTNAALGVLELTEAVVETETSGVISRVAVSGTGRFTPHSGGPVVSLGLECGLPAGSAQPPPFICSGAIAQPFPALGLSLASTTALTIALTPLSGNSGSDYRVAFTGAQSTTETGSIGALSIVMPTSNTFAIAGKGTAIGSDRISGQAALFALFAPTPTGWTVVNATDRTTFSVNIVNNAEAELTGSVTTAAGKSLAHLTLDQSGTGTIVYAGGSSLPITNWTLGG